jgi:hypothetical protein
MHDKGCLLTGCECDEFTPSDVDADGCLNCDHSYWNHSESENDGDPDWGWEDDDEDV